MDQAPKYKVFLAQGNHHVRVRAIGNSSGVCEAANMRLAMERQQFFYNLPPELIAQEPLPHRGESRLLWLDAPHDTIADLGFAKFGSLLRPGDVLVFNDTRVIPARLHGQKDSGGRVELLVERVVGAHSVIAQLRASKTPRAGTRLNFEHHMRAVVEGRNGDLFRVRFEGHEGVLELLERHGHIPLPPYIRRADEPRDRERYQTVYARQPGAVAAPTAGLHFDQEMLDRLRAQGVEQTFVTLHVGAGTFQPMRTERLEDHRMHSEFIDVPQGVVDSIAAAKARGGRVIAVGTTVVRSLETAAQSGALAPYSGETDIFIYPGYEFRVVDALLTNFHLPESTLLMLVCAFGGYERVMRAYRHAVAEGYRFFSYGDAMFIDRAPVGTAGVPR